jgi:hypothetical protein
MNVAVLYYEQTKKTPGMPGFIPSEVREIGDATAYSEGIHAWEVMSLEEYEVYHKACEPAYLWWDRYYGPRQTLDPAEESAALSAWDLISRPFRRAPQEPTE